MSPLPLLLLLLVCGAQASHFYGTVMTYYPKNTRPDGSVTVVLRHKQNFHTCIGDTWTCASGNCGTVSSVLHKVDSESGGDWCQSEGIITRLVTSNAPFQLRLDGVNWIFNTHSIRSWRAVTLVELRNRSDTGQANRSPQTTILPAVRVPSNCGRNFSLLAFDPDGDEVKCRYANLSLSECRSPCTQPSVLTLSSSCSLSFGSTNSSNQGAYIVQMVMEDFPRQNISLTRTNGLQEVKTTSDAISKIPVQFAVRVGAAAPSCTEGLYLPKFLPPTPANGARLYTPVNQTLEISINAEANNSTISELLFSGPHNTNETTSGVGRFTLRWTPSENEDGESHPVCFVVQAISNSVKYHSELRCVIVSVGNATKQTTTTILSTTTPSTTTITTTTTSTTPSTTTVMSTTTPETTTNITTTVATSEDTTPSPTPVDVSNQIVIGLRIRLSSLSRLTEENIRNTVIQQLKDELVRRGLPSDSTLRLVSSVQLEPTTTATPVVST